MDFIEIIILLAFVLFSLFGRLKKKKKRPAPSPPPGEGGAKKPLSLEQIFRELEALQQQGSRTPPAPAQDGTRARSRPPQPASAETPMTAEEAFERAQQGHSPHEEHGFSLDSPLSEETFEQQPLDPLPPLHEPGHLLKTPHSTLGPGLMRPTSQEPYRHAKRWRKRLDSPKDAREAVVLKEILDGPWTPR